MLICLADLMRHMRLACRCRDDSGVPSCFVVLCMPAPSVDSLTCDWNVDAVPECRWAVNAGGLCHKPMAVAVMNSAVIAATEHRQ